MLACLSFLLLSTAALADWYHQSKAFDITVENVKTIVGQDKHVILDFFTPWCIYCQYMAADWSRVWDYYNGPQGVRIEDIVIAKINCGDEPNHPVCREFEVHSFPTILHFEPGSSQAINIFRGNRHYVEFIKWIDLVCPPSAEQQLRTTDILNQKEELMQLQIQREKELNEEKEELEGIMKTEPPLIVVESHKPMNTAEVSGFNEQIKVLATQFETYMKENESLKELEDSMSKLEDKISMIQHQGSTIIVNWYHSFVFIIFGAFLGVLLSFVLMKHYSNKIEYEEKSV